MIVPPMTADGGMLVEPELDPPLPPLPPEPPDGRESE